MKLSTKQLKFLLIHTNKAYIKQFKIVFVKTLSTYTGSNVHNLHLIDIFLLLYWHDQFKQQSNHFLIFSLSPRIYIKIYLQDARGEVLMRKNHFIEQHSFKSYYFANKNYLKNDISSFFNEHLQFTKSYDCIVLFVFCIAIETR